MTNTFYFQDDEYRVRKMDDLTWTLEQRNLAPARGRVAGAAIRYKNLSYHRTLTQACKALAMALSDATEAATVRDYIEELDRILARMERVVLAAVGER